MKEELRPNMTASSVASKAKPHIRSVMVLSTIVPHLRLAMLNKGIANVHLCLYVYAGATT